MINKLIDKYLYEKGSLNNSCNSFDSSYAD